MLDNIRSASDSIIVRLLLGLIVLAFASWGIKDVLLAKNNQELVVFTKAKNITENDFLKAKSEEISILQKQNQINLSDEDIKNLGLNQIVLEKLINEKMLDYIVHYYDLDLSDDGIIFLIKQLPYFKNEKEEFDIKIFKTFLNNTYQSEEQYLKKTREKLLKDTLISIFLEAFKTPELMIDNIVNYLAEKRKLDLVEFDLSTQVKGINIPTPSEDQLKEYYLQHQKLFVIPEVRSFNYLKISSENTEGKISFSEQELLDLYNEKKKILIIKNFLKLRQKL